MGRLVRSAFSIPTATAIGAPAWPEPPTAARNAWTLLVPGDRRRVQRRQHRGRRSGEQKPSPGTTRPVPNRLSMLSDAHHRVAVLDPGSRSWWRPAAGAAAVSGQVGRGQQALRHRRHLAASAPPPPSPSGQPRCQALDGSRCSVERRSGGQPAIGRRRQECHLVAPVGSDDGGRRCRGNAPRRSASASGPPASGDCLHNPARQVPG